MKNKPYLIAIFMLLCLAGCVTSQAAATLTPTPKAAASATATPEPGLVCPPPATPAITPTPGPTPTPTITPTPGPSPTPGVFKPPPSCGGLDENGHILYINNLYWPELNPASQYDLYIMNGNGCYPRLMLTGVSGSPAWSADGKKIAIGCENNSMLCLLDAEAVLRSCAPEQPGDDPCVSPDSILSRIALPEEATGKNYLMNIGWSPDGASIFIEIEGYYSSEITRYYYGFILNLTQPTQWTLFRKEEWACEFEWSPTDSNILSCGAYVFNLEDGDLEQFLDHGSSSIWSPDGEQMAILYTLWEKDKEPVGIVRVDRDTGEWDWIYEPVNWDANDRLLHNIVIAQNYHYRIMDWSPDGRYIAFVNHYRNMWGSYIFRIDVVTKEIYVLTTQTKINYAPAWGP